MSMNELSRRIVSLDARRGLAVFGILGLNTVSCGLPKARQCNLAAAGSDSETD
jgi:uncharacterized membrane protein YeiB